MLWGTGSVSGCLARGPGVIKAKERCESLMTEVVGRISSGLVGLHMKGLLLGMSLGTGHPLEGPSLQRQQDPRVSKHQNIKNKRYDQQAKRRSSIAKSRTRKLEQDWGLEVTIPVGNGRF